LPDVRKRIAGGGGQKNSIRSRQSFVTEKKARLAQGAQDWPFFPSAAITRNAEIN